MPQLDHVDAALDISLQLKWIEDRAQELQLNLLLKHRSRNLSYI